jgi:hypothetical protein
MGSPLTNRYSTEMDGLTSSCGRLNRGKKISGVGLRCLSHLVQDRLPGFRAGSADRREILLLSLQLSRLNGPLGGSGGGMPCRSKNAAA